MKTERVLWRVAVACAVLLLVVPLTPRTSWTSEDGAGARHSAGWESIVAISGVVAIVSLSIGRVLRPGVLGAVIAAATASFFLGVAAAASLGHWLDLMSGSLVYRGWSLRPAPGAAYFAGIATAGMMATLVLLGTWLRSGNVSVCRQNGDASLRERDRTGYLQRKDSVLDDLL